MLSSGIYSLCAYGMQRLYLKGEDMNALGNYDSTPLHRATQKGHADVVLQLLAWGMSYLLLLLKLEQYFHTIPCTIQTEIPIFIQAKLLQDREGC